MGETIEGVAAYAAADLAWHADVVDAAHNRFLSGIHAALAEILREERTKGVRLRLRAGQSGAATAENHAAILEALVAHDADAAETAMLSHLERARRVYRAYLEEAAHQGQ